MKAAERPIGPTPRAPSPCSWTAASAASCSSSARRTSWRPRSGSRTWFRHGRARHGKGPEATADRAKEIEDLQLLPEGAHRAGRRRAHRGRGGQHPRLYLHIQGERGVNAVLVEPPVAHRSWPTTSRCTSRSPAWVPARGRARRRRRKGAGHPGGHHRNEGKPEQAIGKIVEGGSTGTSKRSASWSSRTPRTTSSRSASSSATPPGPVRPGRDRLSTRGSAISPDGLEDRSPRWRRVVLKLSGEAPADASGFGLSPKVLDQIASEWPRPGGSSGSTWPSWSGAATSGAVSRGRARGWTRPRPTTWG